VVSVLFAAPNHRHPEISRHPEGRRLRGSMPAALPMRHEGSPGGTQVMGESKDAYAAAAEKLRSGWQWNCQDDERAREGRTMDVGVPLEQIVEHVTNAGFVIFFATIERHHVCTIRRIETSEAAIEASSTAHLLVAANQAYTEWRDRYNGRAASVENG
jgi:hypothetical protein